MSPTTTINVQAMTCGHCVNANANASELVTVDGAHANLDTGVVNIASEAPAAVVAAVDEAGHE